MQLGEIATYSLYYAGIVAAVLSIFWRPVIGVYYLIPIIPLQTVRYWMNDLPLGKSVIDIVLLAIAIGLLRRGEKILPKTPFDYVLLIYVIYSFGSLCWGSFYLHRPLPVSLSDPRLADWKSYMTMPLLFYIVTAAVQDLRQIRVIILLMMLAVFALDRNFWGTVSDRNFSTYSDDLRDEGGMGYAGANGLAAFEAQFATVLLALTGFETRRVWRIAYYGLAAFSIVCLLYSLSRGGYVAFLFGAVLIGILRVRKVLVLLAVFALCWTAVVPRAVVQRVFMTHDESGALEASAETRLELWNDAETVIASNPVLGTGFNTYAYMGRVGSYRDTHNIYVKVLLETGVLGLLLFLSLLWKFWMLGWKAFRQAHDPLVKSLGLALAGWLACTLVANFFGDRWTYLQVDGYLWVLAACVCRGLLLECEVPARDSEPDSEQVEPTGKLESVHA
ncbi:MAG: hypothetical protein NVS9B4_15790 [Candidatus Acidiferrum sp.]